MALLIVRDHAPVAGSKPDKKTAAPTHGESGRLIVGPWFAPCLERLDNRVRLPIGHYKGMMTRTRTGAQIRAIRIVQALSGEELHMGAGTLASFQGGRIYVHGIRDFAAADQLEGCIGTPDAEALWLALGGWVEGKEIEIEIKDGGLPAAREGHA